MGRTTFLLLCTSVGAVLVTGCNRARRKDHGTPASPPTQPAREANGGKGSVPADIQARREALETAYANGLVTDAEYAAKNAELQQMVASAPAGSAIRQRLAALDAAYSSGVLTKDEYERRRGALIAGAEAQSPPAPPTAPHRAAGPETPPAPPPEKGKIYRHVIGFSFWYPHDWQVTPGGNALQLVPPNPAMAGGQPAEVYFITGEDVQAEGITEPADPRVLAYLDQQVAALAPTATRTGQPAPVSFTSGKGTVLDWHGTNPQGQKVHLRAHAAIIKGHGVALIALTAGGNMEARSKQLHRIFASFGFGEGQLDRTLVGSWHLLSTYALANLNDPFIAPGDHAQMVRDTNSVLEFHPDGTWVRTNTSHMIVMGSGVALEDKSQKVYRGRWNAGDGALYMVWEDGSWDDMRYRVDASSQPNRLRMAAGKRGETWKRVR